jgi:non-canonical purine NTP pyrophosphatase (RdgB/HAM1 family)
MLPKFFATSNLSKLKHVNHILGEELEHLDFDLIELQSMDLLQIVKKKAEDAYKKAGKKAVLVEDTSFEIEAWRGLPGPFIRFFLETIKPEGILKLLGAEKNRKAIVRSAFAFFDGKKYHIGQGKMRGTITDKVRAISFFGNASWNNLFIPKGYMKTLAEMPNEHLSKGFKKFGAREKALNDLKKNL